MRLASAIGLVLLVAGCWLAGVRARPTSPPDSAVVGVRGVSAAGVGAAIRRAGVAEQRQRRRGRPFETEPPGWTLAVAVGVLAVGVAMAVWGAVRTGINVDEPVHLLRFRTWLDTGWYVPPFSMDGDGPASSVTDVFVYAPVAMLVAHVATVVVGVESWGALESSSEAYAVRHLVVACFGLVGSAAAAVTTRLVLGSWRWGVVAAAMLAALPLWTGHAMFNIKDTPAATGIALTTVGLTAMSRPRITTSRSLRWSATAALATGTVVAMGVRPGSWPIIAAGTTAMVLSTWWVVRRRSSASIARSVTGARIALSALAFAAAGLALATLAPKVFVNVPRLLRSSLAESADFLAWDGWVITNGVGHGVPSPWWYVPMWLGHQIPLVILLLAASGLASAWTRRERQPSGASSPDVSSGASSGAIAERTEGPQVALAVIATMTFVGPLAAIVLDVRLQSGLRQMLFVVPGLAVIATIGWWNAAVSTVRSSAATWLVFLVGSVGIVLPTIDQLRLFPYNYAYFNELATIREIDGRWPTDSLRTSFREAVRFVGDGGEAICSAHPSGPAAPSDEPVDAERRRAFWSCESFPSFGVYSDARGTNPAATLGPAEFWLVRENQFGDNVPSNCARVASVTRPLRTRTVTMSYVAVCASSLDTAPDRSGAGDLGDDG